MGGAPFRQLGDLMVMLSEPVAVATLVCQPCPPAGRIIPYPFMTGQHSLTGGHLRRRDTERTSRFQIELHERRVPGTSHDFIVTAGLHFETARSFHGYGYRTGPQGRIAPSRSRWRAKPPNLWLTTKNGAPRLPRGSALVLAGDCHAQDPAKT
jgi:hypothetical protein